MQKKEQQRALDKARGIRSTEFKEAKLENKKTIVGKRSSYMGSLEEESSSEGIFGGESDENGT